MIDSNDLIIKKFILAFSEKKNKKEDLLSYYITTSSLETLENVNNNIRVYLSEFSEDKKKSLFNIFGMLQSLFVGIDALYSLSYGITNRKWSVNVNTNPNLREIKYIRNDVVGHPTKRTYENNKIGYCDLELENTTYFNLVYRITIPNISNGTTNHNVDLKNVIKSYYVEADKLLVEIYNRMLLENPNINAYLSEMTYRLFREYKRGVRNLNLLENIRKNYIDLYKLEENSRDRYLWRLDIIRELFKWDIECHEDVITYLINMQIEKLYSMSMQCDYEKKDISFQKLEFKYKVPNTIKVFKEFIKEHKISEVKYLMDNKYPLFKQVVRRIRNLGNNNRVVERICNLLDYNFENSIRIYALGSSF